jgi:2-hydroxychromene-2-carboxylate isomerase
MLSAPFNPLQSSSPLTIYIDYKSPYAYLAKDPTYGIEDDLGIEVDWRPFTLDIPSYLGSARLDERGRLVESQRSERQWSVVRYSYRDVRRYASLRGLITRGTTKIWDSSLAAIGMLWAKQQGRAVLRRYTDLVYERFWKRELNIEDAAVLEDLLREAGAQATAFRGYVAGEGRVLHDSIQQAAFDAGIFGVPTYVIKGELFFGREHLPRVRWLLSGRAGIAPDVAYEHDLSDHVSSKVEGPLQVAIDFKSPSAYLAIGPTRSLAEQLGRTIDWQPFLVSSWKGYSAGSETNDRGIRHRRLRAEYIEHDVIRYAAARGLTMRNLRCQADSTLAAIGLLWTRVAAPPLAAEYVQHVFDRYWCEQLDLENESAVRSLLQELGVPLAGFTPYASGEGRTELERLQAELAKAGVFDVPTYLINGDVYVGRQHLPLIRGLLSGKKD